MINGTANEIFERMARYLITGNEPSDSYTAAADSGGGLTIANLADTYNLLKSLQPKMYYALSEYIPDTGKYYKVPVKWWDDISDVWVMHPDSFGKFERQAKLAGYALVDFRTVEIEFSLELTQHHPAPTNE